MPRFPRGENYMNQFFLKHPWLRPLGCGLLVCAFVLSICLPLLGMRSAEPENPILQAEPQDITVLQAGQSPGRAGTGEAESTGAAGSGGSTDSELTGEQEQPDPEQTGEEAGLRSTDASAANARRTGLFQGRYRHKY